MHASCVRLLNSRVLHVPPHPPAPAVHQQRRLRLHVPAVVRLHQVALLRRHHVLRHLLLPQHPQVREQHRLNSQPLRAVRPHNRHPLRHVAQPLQLHAYVRQEPPARVRPAQVPVRVAVPPPIHVLPAPAHADKCPLAMPYIVFGATSVIT